MPPQFARSVRHVLDLNQRIAVDRHLQMELDKGMEIVAAGGQAETRQRLARVLSTVLEPAWIEHTSFQRDALFPIVVKYNGATVVRDLLAQLDREHADISHSHRDVSAFLGNVIVGRLSGEVQLNTCLRQTIALRRDHYAAGTILERLLPTSLDEADCDALESWVCTRSVSGFPVNLILDIWD